MKPVHIAGGGLAGLVLGNLLARSDVPVTLHEAGKLPRHRVCGEFICGRGAALLCANNLGSILDNALAHRSTAWFRGDRKVLEASLPEPAYGLSRFLMDDRLARSFRDAGGTWRESSRLDLREPSEGTVNCTGRTPTKSPWVGLKFHCFDWESAYDLELHLGDGGYLGLSRVEDGRTNVCGLFRRDRSLNAGKEDLLFRYLERCGLRKAARRLRASTVDPTSHAAVAGFSFGTMTHKHGTDLSLGDALGVIPPFTGNGMSLAIESAVLAAEPVLAYAKGERDWPRVSTEVHALTREAFGSRLRAAGRLHPWLTNPGRQKLLAGLARCRLLPFATLYRLTH